jgi:hypothetical protein
MKINKKLHMLLPSVQYGNVTAGTEITVDTDSTNDMLLLGLKGPVTTPEDLRIAIKSLDSMVTEETFAQKDFLESTYTKASDYKISV